MLALSAQSNPHAVEIEAAFLRLLPELSSRANAIGRNVNRNESEELAAEVLAMAWQNYQQAAKGGRWLTASQLAWYAWAYVRDGRALAGSSGTDALATRTKINGRSNVYSFTSFDSQCNRPRRESPTRLERDFVLATTSQERDGPALLTATKLDWMAFARTLTPRMRRLLYRLVRGDPKTLIAHRLGVSKCRVTQLIGDLQGLAGEFFGPDLLPCRR